ncbi:hypothetical protein D6V26_06360, partial [Vibrio cholerae]|nr:hypothetical protein [Vibrio cholerae]
MKPVIEINSAPFGLPNDPLAALEEIASYLSAINYQKSHAVIANEDGEEPYLKGYWQTPDTGILTRLPRYLERMPPN